MSKDDQYWRGTVLLWEEHGLFLGNAGRAEMHESPAIKICVSLDGKFGLSSPSEKFSVDHKAALIPAGVRHAIEGYGNSMAMLLIAPEGDLGQRLFQTAAADTIVDLGEKLAGGLRVLLNDLNDDEVASSHKLDEAIEMIAGSFEVSDSQGIDPRVLQSIEWIRSGRERGFLVKDLAAEVDLSESRFSHIFSEHVRVPVRRYLLWLRLRDVLHLLASTGSLTEAAHSAGFSDSAHLSRTFRSALGIAPTDLTRESSLISFLK
ncbi:MAG: helix-turn-helix transcriptional regulator [Acidobacteria bacterium]|nr:helix-turn-helix transcriptional regulator [Acidobacteriota bacterium]